MYNNCNPMVNYFVNKTCDNTWSLKKGIIEFTDLTFVIQGSAIYEVDGETVKISAGEGVFIPTGHMRAATTGGMTCCAFNMTFDCEEPVLSTKFTWRDIDVIPNLLREFGVYWEGMGKYDGLKCKAIILEILHFLLVYEDNQSTNQYIKEIKQYIFERNLTGICVKDIARYIGLNEVYCGALFKRLVGVTIIEYIDRLRIEKATNMLKYDYVSISEVASQCGFEDVSYFCRVFKKLKGIAPTLYKSNLH